MSDFRYQRRRHLDRFSRTSGTPRRHAPAARTRYHLGAAGRARRVAKSSSGATPRRCFAVKGEMRDKHLSRGEKERREKRQSEAAGGQPCLRRRTRSSAGRRGSLANPPRRAAATRRFHFCARFTRGSDRPLLGDSARHDTMQRRYASTTYLSCTHHTRCML